MIGWGVIFGYKAVSLGSTMGLIVSVIQNMYRFLKRDVRQESVMRGSKRTISSGRQLDQ